MCLGVAGSGNTNVGVTDHKQKNYAVKQFGNMLCIFDNPTVQIQLLTNDRNLTRE